MPTIDFKNHVPGVDPRLPDLPDRLDALGLGRPAALDDALTAARWSVPSADFDKLRRDVETAKNQAEYGDAVLALADAHARQDILTGDSADAHKLRSELTRISASRVQRAFRAVVPDIFDRIDQEYRTIGMEFAENIRAIKPESLSAGPLELERMQKMYMQDAKEQGDKLTALIDTYDETARLAGHTKITGIRPNEAEEIACRFGEYDSLAEWSASADLICAFANDRGAYDPAVEAVNPDARIVRYSVFGLAAAIKLAGGRTFMFTPRKAKEIAAEYREERARSSVWTGTGEGRIPV